MDEYIIMMTPNQKEIIRGDNGYTSVVRPNHEKGGWNAAIVVIETGLPVFRITHCETQDSITKALASDLRMMDKCGFACKMAWKSRRRHNKQKVAE